MGKFKKGHEPWNKGKKELKKEPIDWRIVCTAIVSVAGIEAVCLFNGVNGTALSLSIGVIGALAGLSLPQLKLKKN